MGWTLEERRDRIVVAALQLAADQGTEHVNLRAAAHSAGISWDGAREIFDDHADLLRAMSRTVTAQNMDVASLRIDGVGPFPEILEGVLLQLWGALSARRDHQIVSYELALVALRRTFLRSLATEQHEQARGTAGEVLAAVAETHGVRWTTSTDDLARLAATFLEGLSITWVVDADDAAARRQVRLLAELLAGHAEPDR